MNTEISEELIGEWSINAFVTDNSKTLCNQCPTIEFKNTKTALLKRSNEDMESYTWTLTEKVLSIENVTTDAPNSYFKNGSYSLSIIEKDKYFELDMKSENGFSYILRKTKTGANKK